MRVYLNFIQKDKHLSLKNKNLIYHQIITIKDQPCEMEICCTIDNVLLVRIEPFELNKTKEYQVICVPQRIYVFTIAKLL